MNWEAFALLLIANAVVLGLIVAAFYMFLDLQQVRDPSLSPTAYWSTLLLYAAVLATLWYVAVVLYRVAYGRL